MDERNQKIIKFYAHDYRDMKMNEIELGNILYEMIKTIECEHQCSSNCRKNGCNCDCGEYHQI